MAFGLLSSSVRRISTRRSLYSTPIPIPKSDIYQPAGTTRVLALSFDGGSMNKTGSWTVNTTGSVSYPTTGGVVSSGGYASGFSNSNYLQVSELSGTSSGRGYTFVAWYKGSQTNSSSYTIYSPSVPIFGDNRNSVYIGFGLTSGKIHVAAGGSEYTGSSTVADNNWKCLVWIYRSNDLVDGYVNGTKEISNADVSGSSNYNRVDMIGNGYQYSGVQDPSALDGVQIYSGVLTDAQILEIYQNGV